MIGFSSLFRALSLKLRIVVVAGPTASGKTAFSVALASALGGEVVEGPVTGAAVP